VEFGWGRCNVRGVTLWVSRADCRKGGGAEEKEAAEDEAAADEEDEGVSG
jgi:hypothetical protein